MTRNDNDDLQLNARVTWQPFGDVKYSEGDFDSTDKPLFAIAAQYESNEFPIAAAGATPAHAVDRTIVGGDVVFKYKGFFLFGELFQREQRPQQQPLRLRRRGVQRAGRLLHHPAEV